MKKSRMLIILILNVMMVFMVGCSDKNNGNVNPLGGKGQLHNAKARIKYSRLYDDENIYFYVSSKYQLTDLCIKFTKNNKLMINCDNSACLHNAMECKATADYKFFEFNNKTYKYGNSKIKTADGKEVFENSVPKDLEDEDANNIISWVEATEDNRYAVVVGYGFQYLINDKFEIVYTIKDLGGTTWTKLYKDKCYYVNDTDSLVEIDISSGTKRNIVSVEKVSTITDDGEYIFYFDNKNRLHKYSLETDADNIIKEHMPSPCFMAYDGYIYYEDSAWPGSHKEISDYDGNIIRDCTDCKNMSMEDGFKIKDKIYNNYTDDSGKLWLAVMNEDGTDYKEYKLEN
ncbi:MAG: hypothetical protein MR361_03205 [Clostridiales bacterium]|nr:hypothetical protein [Clostridiales bacterium]MDD6292467.1 hypothetical protein [Eubacteriales bacterium]